MKASKSMQLNFKSLCNMRAESFFFYVLIALAWCKNILLDYLQGVILKLPFFGAWANVIIDLVFVFTIILAIPVIVKKLTVGDLIFYIIYVLAYALNILIRPENRNMLLDKMFDLFITIVPFYFIGRVVDIEKDGKYIAILSVLSVIARIFYMVLFEDRMSSEQSQFQGNMPAAYDLLPHLCVVFVVFCKKSNLLGLFAFIFEFALLFVFGTRGPLLLLMIFCAAYVLTVKKIKHPVVLLFCAVIACGIALLFYEKILAIIRNVAISMGMSVRIIDKIMQGEIFGDSGRGNIITQLLVDLNKKPFIGYGFFADRNYDFAYAHNLVVELFFNFGYVVGGILFIVFTLIMIKGLIKALKEKKENTAVAIMTLMASSYLKLFLSGSYLEEVGLYVLLGICVAILTRSDKNRTISKGKERLE